MRAIVLYEINEYGCIWIEDNLLKGKTIIVIAFLR